MRTMEPVALKRRFRGRSWVLVACLVLLMLAGCSDDDDGIVTPTIVHGSGIVAQEDRTVTGCTAVSFASEGDLHLIQGAPEGLRIEAEDNLLPYLESRMAGATLEVWTTPGFDLRPTQSIDFYLTVPTLQSIEHGGVGATDGDGLTAPLLAITQSGVGGIHLTGLAVDDLDVVMDGVGPVVLSGAAGSVVNRQVVMLSGVGDYDAGALCSTEAAIAADGTGSATLCVNDRLEVTAGGTGTVSYYGSPVVVPPGAAIQIDPVCTCN